MQPGTPDNTREQAGAISRSPRHSLPGGRRRATTGPQPALAASFERHRLRRTLALVLTYAVLMAGAAVILMPLVWMISTSLKPLDQTLRFPPVWIPDPVMWQNYVQAVTIKPFGLFALNSTIVTLAGVVGNVLSSAIVAYGFARLRFPGRDILFIVVLSTMMVPIYVKIVPLFILFKQLGWLDTYLPLVVPGYFGEPFYIFLLRQFFLTIPLEMDDAAKIDGCGYFDTFWRILLPLIKPALGAVAVFSFLAHWNDFFLPLVVLNSVEKWTIPLGLLSYRGFQGSALGLVTQWNLIMAVSFLAMLPSLLLFFLAQRHFIQGIVVSGVKG